MATLDAIDRRRPQKLYCQLAELLRAHIESGEWPVGTQVPTEEHLCRSYDVSKATVRLAVEELVALGYLKKFQGKGTFVRRKKPEHGIQLLTNVAENGTCRNPSCLVKLVEYKVLRPGEVVRADLKLGEDDNCHRFLVSTSKFDAPYQLQRTWIPYALAPTALSGDDAERVAGESPYVFVETLCHLRIERLRETADVGFAGEEDGALLGVECGAPLLRVKHVCTGPGGAPFACSESLYRTSTDAKATEFERLGL